MNVSNNKLHVLLTGCAGFIGSHLCEKLLAEGHRVTGVDNFDPFYDKKIKLRNLSASMQNSMFRFVETDLSEENGTENLRDNYNVVIHLAAKAGVLPSIKNPEAYLRSNITGTLNILELMKDRGIRKLVFGSSSSIYGNNKKTPFGEDDNVDHPISPYAFTKKSCELLTHTYHHLYRIDVLNLRFFTVYGPRQRPDLAIHKFVRLMSENKPITLYGKGETARDYTFVGDIVNGILGAVDFLMKNNNAYEIINIGNNKPVKLKDLVEMLYELTGKQKNITCLPEQAGDVELTYADISKASRLLNYQPLKPLREGLEEFISWMRDEYRISSF